MLVSCIIPGAPAKVHLGDLQVVPQTGDTVVLGNHQERSHTQYRVVHRVIRCADNWQPKTFLFLEAEDAPFQL